MSDRPTCAMCGGMISRELLTDRDIEAEIEYARRTRGTPREFYCSPGCFRVACDEPTSRRSIARRNGVAERGKRTEAAERRSGDVG